MPLCVQPSKRILWHTLRYRNSVQLNVIFFFLANEEKMCRWQGHTHTHTEIAIPMVDGCTFCTNDNFIFLPSSINSQAPRVSCVCVIWKAFNHTHTTHTSHELLVMVKRGHFNIFSSKFQRELLHPQKFSNFHFVEESEELFRKNL